MSIAISCQDLRFSRGSTEVLHGINFSIPKGGIVGLLGKNGAGKSTTLGVLMGYLAPDSGYCTVLGEPSQDISAATRAQIGLLHESFIQYNFMTIKEIEHFYSAFYTNWKSEVFWDLVHRMNLPDNRQVWRLSCGQRSQITLGLILAQQAELLILDDFSMGLDVGYRRLFLEFLRDYVNQHQSTVLLTSHVVSELEDFLDHVIVLKEGRILCDETLDEFKSKYHEYRIPKQFDSSNLVADGSNVINIERGSKSISLFSSRSIQDIKIWLHNKNISDEVTDSISENKLSFEDIFVGLTGRY